jgi:hypothetical protein
MKTLIIHPDDRSTDFLKPIYENVTDATVVTGGLTKSEVYKLIEQHDRIYMMGHGSPGGLFSMGKFLPDPLNPYNSLKANLVYKGWSHGSIIDHDTVSLLENKECIFIWCNADQFVKKHNLKGLYSGMFISEVGEAHYCGLPNTPQSIVDVSNDSFARWMGENANMALNEIYHNTMDNYEVLAMDNPVADYNAQRLCLAE